MAEIRRAVSAVALLIPATLLILHITAAGVHCLTASGLDGHNGPQQLAQAAATVAEDPLLVKAANSMIEMAEPQAALMEGVHWMVENIRLATGDSQDEDTQRKATLAMQWLQKQLTAQGAAHIASGLDSSTTFSREPSNNAGEREQQRRSAGASQDAADELTENGLAPDELELVAVSAEADEGDGSQLDPTDNVVPSINAEAQTRAAADQGHRADLGTVTQLSGVTPELSGCDGANDGITSALPAADADAGVVVGVIDDTSDPHAEHSASSSAVSASPQDQRVDRKPVVAGAQSLADHILSSLDDVADHVVASLYEALYGSSTSASMQPAAGSASGSGGVARHGATDTGHVQVNAHLINGDGDLSWQEEVEGIEEGPGEVTDEEEEEEEDRETVIATRRFMQAKKKTTTQGKQTPSPTFKLSPPPSPRPGDDPSSQQLDDTDGDFTLPDYPDYPDSPALMPPPSPRPPKKGSKSLSTSLPNPPSPRPPPPPPNTPNNEIGPREVDGVYEMVGLAYAVAVHLANIPGTNRYLFMERPSGKHPDKKNIIAGYFDLDTRKYYNVPNIDSLFCNGATIMADGNIGVVGGHIPKSGYKDGMRSLRIYDRARNTLKTIRKMTYPRWYPTITLLPDKRLFIMGGTQRPGAGTRNNPMSEIWDPSDPASPIVKTRLDGTYVSKIRDIYYPNNYILPSGDMFTYCDSTGLIMDPYTSKVRSRVPSHTSFPNSKIKAVRMQYPYSATSVMLALLPEKNYATEFVFFGGQYKYGWINTGASPAALRLRVNYSSETRQYSYSSWTSEAMGAGRVMGDSVLLPNGFVVILNGAKNGVAGDSASGGASKANYPNFYANLYNPNAPHGRRFRRLARSQIARMYHSTASLTPDGRILVAGCDRCNYFKVREPFSRSPWGLPEYRVEQFSPPFVFSPLRPVLTHVQQDIVYGETFTATYKADANAVTAATLVAPSSTTHSTNMHQRVVGLVIVGNNVATGNLVLMAPPNNFIAPPGMYMLFLLNGDIYSSALWVTLSDGMSEA